MSEERSGGRPLGRGRSKAPRARLHAEGRGQELKRRRQRALLDLVRREPLSTQEEIREALARLGFEATQSTISRDLEEMGLVRVRDAQGRMRYARPGEAGTAAAVARLRTLLAEFVERIEASGNLAVVTTPPGAANAVAEAIDHAGVEGVLGTVAGDNTILVVAREGVRGRAVAERLRALAGLTGGRP
ncbi:MAG TPA: arginine repressor [Actinomycetota bacterium]|nr:arginine repressor [Actinomycetota bacterium]